LAACGGIIAIITASDGQGDITIKHEVFTKGHGLALDGVPLGGILISIFDEIIIFFPDPDRLVRTG